MKKYFKVVNPKGHHGMTYKEGYNEDILPFNPNGECEPGGLYFASEDIFAFLDYGEDVYEVEPIGEIYEESRFPKKYKAHSLNMKYLGKTSDLEVVKYLVKHSADIHAQVDYALRISALNGHFDVVKYFVEHGANIHVLDNYALRYSAYNGHLDVVKYLIERGANIHAEDNYALRWSAEKGYLDIVKYLVENGADIHAQNDYALRWSVENGHHKVVKYLKEQINKIS